MATVAGTPYDFDDLLEGTSSPWKRRLIAGGIIVIIAAVAGFFTWNQWFRGGSTTAAPVFTQATVSTGNVTKSPSARSSTTTSRTTPSTIRSSRATTDPTP